MLYAVLYRTQLQEAIAIQEFYLQETLDSPLPTVEELLEQLLPVC